MPFDGTNLSQTKRDLIAVRELLLASGWVPKCGTWSTAGPNCIATAIDVVSLRTLHRNAMYDAVRRLIPTSVPEWNDAQTSIEPVLALLDKAIAAA